MQGQSTARVTCRHLGSISNADLAATLEAAGAKPVIGPVLDVRVENMLQRRTLAQLAAPITELARTATPEQRPHLRAVIDTVRALAESGRRADAGTATIAALIDPITNVHEFAGTVRPLLAAVSSPQASREHHAANLAELHAVFARTLPRTRHAFSLRPLLGVTRYTQLAHELAAWEQLQGREAGCVR